MPVLNKRLLCQSLMEDSFQPGRPEAGLEHIELALGADAPREILYYLTRMEFEAREAAEHWQAITAHRADLSRRLERDPGMRTALCDYFLNIAPRVKHPVLVEVHLLRRQEELALTDELTGVANRRRFNAELDREIERYRRFGQSFCLAMFDLDHFKTFNDSYGHAVGDAALKAVADELVRGTRSIDLVSRFGGEEFTLLMPQTDKDQALAVTDRIRARIGKLKIPAGFKKWARLTVSGGIATFPEDAYSTEGLVRRADAALYLAKRTRNRVFAFQDDPRKFRRLRMEMDASVRLDDKGQECRCSARDLSLGGMMCEGRMDMNEGARVAVTLLPESGEPRTVQGRVLRVEPDPKNPGELLAALAFEAVLPEDRSRLLDILKPACAALH